MAQELFSNAEFGRQLREARKQAGVTQEQLADAVTASSGQRLHRSAIAKIESGDRPASLDEAVYITTYLGVSLAELAIPKVLRQRHARVLASVNARLKIESLQHEVAKLGWMMQTAVGTFSELQAALAEVKVELMAIEVQDADGSDQ